MKNKIANTVRNYTVYIPMAWVLTCYDLGINWIETDVLGGTLTVLACTLIVSVLHVIGEIAAYDQPSKEKKLEDANLWSQIKRLIILLVVLFVFTSLIANRVPNDVI